MPGFDRLGTAALAAITCATALASTADVPVRPAPEARGNRLVMPAPEGSWTPVAWSTALDSEELAWLPRAGDGPSLPSRVKGVTWRAGTPPPAGAPVLSIQRVVVPRDTSDADVLDALLQSDWTAPRDAAIDHVTIGNRRFTSRAFDLEGSHGVRHCLQLAWAQPHGRRLAEVLHVMLLGDAGLTPDAFSSAQSMVSHAMLAPPLVPPTTPAARMAYLEDLALVHRDVPVQGEASPARAFDLELEGAPTRGVAMDFDDDGCVDAFATLEGTALSHPADGRAGTPVGRLAAVVITTCVTDDDFDGTIDAIAMGGGDMDGDGIVDSRILLEDDDGDGLVDRGRHYATDPAHSTGSVQSFWGRLRVRRWTPQGASQTDWLRRDEVLSRARLVWNALRSGCAHGTVPAGSR